MKPAVRTAMAVAATVMTLTLAAHGQADPAPTPPAPAVEAPTPLVLRPSKPLEVVRESPAAGVGWKLFAFVVVCAGAYLLVRRRLRPPAPDQARLSIVRRVGIGLRSELLVVDVEGQRLLLGVTASSIQSLASLDPPAAADDVTESASSPAARRFAAMLEAAEQRPPADRHLAAARAAASSPDEDDVPGQARGLLRLGRR